MNIAELIRKLNNGRSEMYCKICTVDSVDEDKRVCDVSPIDGSAPLLDVNLQANQESKNGVVVFPKKNSYVVVGFLTPDVGVVLLADEIEKIDIAIEDTTIVVDKDGIVINGGDNNGLVIAEKVAGKISNLEKDINSLKQYLTAWMPAPMDGGAALKGIITNWAAQMIQPTTNKEDIMNNKITH